MTNEKIIKQGLFLGFCLVFTLFSTLLRAEDVPPAFRSTEFPLPRFVSLGSGEVHVRTGPGMGYPIKWVFHKRNLPVEIVLEYETWRKIKDSEGQVGWVHSSLLSGRRTGLIRAEGMVPVRRKPKEDARLNAYIEAGAIVALDSCKESWCHAAAQGYEGWVERKFIWGVYENENFD
jgi:SH3-like domain-containing protein